MNRTEAQKTAGAEHPLYRPLSLGTMSLLQRIDNKSLAAIMGGGKLQAVDYDDFVVFLYAHSRDNALSEIRHSIMDGTVVDKAYDWLDSKSPMDVAEGVDYFTDTQTRAQLLTPQSDGKTTEKKTEQDPIGSPISPPSSDTISTSHSKKSTKRRTP